MVRPLRLDKLRKKLHVKHVGILVIVLFFLSSLRVINWFEYPRILISGDFRPPLIQEAFVKRVLYTWDETDFGMPSVYAPRILVPSYFFMSVVQAFGASLYVAQMMALFLMYFLSSILMFVFMKRLTNGNVAASFVAALYLTSNLYMINDREVTAIGFLDVVLVILPCLAAFTEGIVKRSYSFMALSGLLFVLTYGSFPNFRVALLCLIALVLILLFIFMNTGLRISYRRDKASKLLGLSVDMKSLYVYLKNISVFIVFALLASIWIITIISTNFEAFFQTYKQMGAPQLILDIRLHDLLRLITKWGFYSGSLGKPYIPYADTYLHNPLIIILSYLPPILAFTSLLVSKSRKLTIYFSATAALFLVLTSGFNPLSSKLYLALSTYIPFMIAFRESAQWSFFVIISYSILIGITLSTLYDRFKGKALRIITLSLAIIILLASSYPLTTGDVARNWLNTDVKGSILPDSYTELNGMLSNQYWALLLPQRYTYVIYNFSGIPFGSGNPYPLIFSKPIISGLGTEYMQSENLGLLNRVYELMLTNGARGVSKFLGMLGVKYLILEKNLVSGNVYDVSELRLDQNENFVLTKEWDEVALYNNTHSLQKLYTADNILNYTTLDDMFQIVEESKWETLQRSALLNLTSTKRIRNNVLVPPENFVWSELSPTSYVAHVESKGAFVLVFLESYDEHWKVSVNGNQIQEKNHQEVNAFANGWLIDSTGDVTITIQYETQNIFIIFAVASIVLPLLLLAFFSRKSAYWTNAIRKAQKIKRGIRRKPIKVMRAILNDTT